ncbi:MAG: T9SS type A sorting domain-containing protein [Bacteroidia bacterium]|nr:T9SS type A sorting domain-containing protein [Bacteroidia bacterium]
MKKTLPISLRFSFTFYKSVLLIAAILFSTIATNGQITTITPTYVAPTVFGGCIDTVFSLSYVSPKVHTLKISASLNGEENNCSSSGIYQILVTPHSVSGATFVVDTANAAIVFTVANGASVNINWHVHIDCSILSLVSTNQTVNLIQKFADSTNQVAFNLGSGSDSTLTNVKIPYLESSSTSTEQFYASYLTQHHFDFKFYNFSEADVNIKFKFHVNDTTICNKAHTDSFAYSTSLFGTFTKFMMDDATEIFLPKDSDLVIRQYVTGDSCFDINGCNGLALFKWQCAFSDSIENYFCNSCGKTDSIDFNVKPDENPLIKIENLTPSNYKNDFTCFNTMQSWSYRILHNSTSTNAADSFFVSLAHYSGSSAPNNLTLIPTDSINVQCLNCSYSVTYINDTNAVKLCTGLVPNSLSLYSIKVYNFEIGDTLLLNFKTLRCAEENDAALLNRPKNLNNWVLGTAAYDVCGKQFANQAYLSSENFDGYSTNIDQQLQFFPTFTNITVSNPPLSDTLFYTVDLKGLDKRWDYFSNQHFGVSRDSAEFPCKAKGILRVRITLNEGLHIFTDSLVYFQTDTGLIPLKIYPDYYYHVGSSCHEDTLYFYFHLSDTMYYILNAGSFHSNVEACCPNTAGNDTYYKMDFHVMPFPNSNCISNSNWYVDTTHTQPPNYTTTTAFIPMSGVTHNIHIHCPGCLTPGTIVEQYKLKRISFGLQDSNNNGLADSNFIPIVKNSNWFNANQNKIQQYNSSYGDRLCEYTVANFVDGDYSNGGYDYSQMKATGAIFNYLQYGVALLSQGDSGLVADTTMQQQLGLTPDSLVFYIDEKNPGNPFCIDCNDFETGTDYRTVLKLAVPSTGLNKFMQADTANATWFYTFSFVPPDSNSVIGITNPYKIYYNDTLFHDSLAVGQRYRIAVYYNECAHFAAPTYNLTLDNVMKRREISTQMWFTGKNHGINTFNDISQEPQSYAELNLHGWKVYNDNSLTLPNVNQQFADSFIFFCEMNGGMHYFFSQDLTFSSFYQSDKLSCGMNMIASTYSRVAGHIYDPYPFEYRTPALYLNKLSFKQPSGFTANGGIRYNYIYIPFGNFSFTSAPTHFITPAPDIDNFINLNTNAIAQPACIDEKRFWNLPITDSSAYVGDNYVGNDWYINFQPINCFANFVVHNDTAIYGISSNINLPCLSTSVCATTDTVKGEYLQSNITSKANLKADIFPYSNGAISNEFCWHIDLTNPKINIDSVSTSTAMQYFKTATASHIYFVPPDVNYLNNWVFTPDYNSNIHISIPNDSIFHWADSLPADGQLSGTFCATYFPCIGLDTIPFILGYDCNHYPAAPFGSDTTCTTYVIDSIRLYDVTTLPPTATSNPVSFSICAPTEKIVDFTISSSPFLFPDSVVLYNMPNQITIDSAFFSLCDNVNLLHKLTSASTSNSWLINADSLVAAGYPDSALNQYNTCIRIHLFLHQSCNFINGVTGDSLKLFTHNYCNDVFSKANLATTFVWDSTTHCNDCFTVTKTANNDSILVGDTLTYIITACANNQFPQQINVVDSIPPNFTITYTELPYSGLIGADTCLTFIIKGVFSTSDFDSCFNNAAWLQHSLNNVWHHDDTCIKVMPPCYVAGMIILSDSTLSSTLTTTTNTFFYVDSTLIIDTNTTFANCTLYVATGGSIVVMPGDTLTLDSSFIEGCGYMWQGLKIDTTGFIYSFHSRVRDANTGIAMKSSGGFFVDSSQVIDCVKGIYVPQRSCNSLNSTFGLVQGTTFGLERAAFLPDYTAQPAHGVLPKAGIDVSDMVVTFGNNSTKRNYFHNMNTGIVGYRSDIDLYNSVFRNIYEDTIYTEDYIGTAIVCLGYQGNCHVNGDITIQQVPNGDTLAKNIYRGIYTRYSNLLVSGNKITNATIGIYGTNTSEGLHANVVGCYIQASSRGINWYGNAGAYYMNAENDTILITGDSLGMGIKISEAGLTANHRLENNVIITEGKFGINAIDVIKPLIGNNKIKYNRNNSSSTTIFRGIALDGCDSSTVTCNVVEGNTVSDTMKVGIHTSISNVCTFTCNNVDSTGWGIFFGGVNMETSFKGNAMKDHYFGLQLNKTAVTDTQTHAGNHWVGTYGSTYGARNYNAATFAKLRKSLFVVDPSGDASLIPTTPSSNPNNIQWFEVDPGYSPFECTGGFDCESYGSRSGGSSELQMSIAKGDTITSEFVNESNSMAQQFLFSDLKYDSTKLASDTVLQNFVNDKENEAIGLLYKTKMKLQSSANYDSSFDASLTQIDSLRKIYSDSIYQIDLSGNTYQKRIILINQLNYLSLQRQNLLQIKQAAILNDLSAAESFNNQVSPTQIPEENEKFMNSILIMYRAGGKDSIAHYYPQILSIGQQCPYIGGKPVYKARGFISLFNENIQFDDYNTCLAAGIFRESLNNVQTSDSIIIRVVPNPTSENADLIIDNSFNGICRLKIIDAIGNVVFEKQLDCSVKKHKLDLHQFVSGIYFIQVDLEGKTKSVSKFAIIR